MAEHISAQTLRRQALFWSAALIAFIVFLFVFRGVLLPFVAGFALAYFLDPVADFLERRGLSRLWATVVIVSVFIGIFTLALLVIVPILLDQLLGFLDQVPGYLERLRELAASLPAGVDWLNGFLQLEPGALSAQIEQFLTDNAAILGDFATRILSGGLALVNVLGLLVVTPVVAFYMLLDWDRMVSQIDACIPRDYVDSVRRLGRDVNAAVAGFIRGQGTVCLILAVFYATALTLVGLNFGLLIGMFVGLISFIPYVGAFVGLFLSVGVALVQFWPDWIMIALVVVIFFVGQTIEGNFLVPKLVGESVGLHPVWLMFALFAFGSLFGFTGMLIAVPASAAVGVLVRFAIARYLDSDLYLGSSSESDR